MLHPSLHHLREGFRTYAASQAPDIAAFCGHLLNAEHAENPHPPAPPPNGVQLAPLADQSTEATRPLTEALLAAAPHLRWQQSYTLNDPGFDAHYLEHYAWANLIAPSGPFVSPDLRLSIGYWGQGLHYPRHWHTPEEIYLTLAGQATYASEGRAPVVGGPGTTICHHSNQPHAARFDTAPALIAAFWRGTGLEAKSDLAT